MQRQRRRALSLFLAVIMLCMTVFPASAASETFATASSMQLMKTTGTVGVTNGSSRNLSVRDNMRLYNG